MADGDYSELFSKAFAKKPKASLKSVPTGRTQLAPDAPAPRIQALIAKRGVEPTEMALCAWDARVKGLPIVDVAHELGVSIESAKILIKEAHDAIAEDLKANLDVNRQLDLDRIDGLLQVYYPLAQKGDPDMANVTIKCIQQRGKLIGLEPQPDPGRSNPAGVLIWIQSQLPNINKIVDSMPLELPPGAPG